MIRRPLLPVLIIVLAPLGIATWILASYTVGESISPPNHTVIGFAIALLAMMAVGYVLLLSEPPEAANVPFGIVLVVCGTVCVLVALVLQFYLAHLASENSRRLAEMMAEGLKRGERLNVNLNATFPDTVKAVAYLALGVGIWLAAMGIRLGVSRRRTAEGARVSTAFGDAPPQGEEAIRKAPG